MDINQSKEAIKAILKTNVTTCILGHSGIGKTQMMQQIADDLGYTLINVRVGQFADAGDIVGIPYIQEATVSGQKITKFAPPSYLPQDGKYLIFLDEINRSLPDVRQAVFQLVLENMIQEWKLPAESKVIAAANPPTRDYDVQEFSDDKAWADRFCFLRMDFSYAAWSSYMMGQEKVTNSFKKFILMSEGETNQLVSYDDYEEITLDWVKATPRSCEAFAEIEFENPNLDLDILQEIAAGMMGTSVASEYIAEKKNPTLFDGKDLLNNFSKFEKKYKEICSQGERIDFLTLIRDTALEEVKRESTPDKMNTLFQVIELMPADLIRSTLQTMATWVGEIVCESKNENYVPYTDVFMKGDRVEELAKRIGLMSNSEKEERNKKESAMQGALV